MDGRTQTWIDLSPGDHIMLGDRIITAAGFAPVDRCIGKKFDPDEHVVVQRAVGDTPAYVPPSYDCDPATKIYEAVYQKAISPGDAAELLKLIRRGKDANENDDLRRELSSIKNIMLSMEHDVGVQKFNTKCVLQILSNYVNMQNGKRGFFETIINWIKRK